MTCKKLCTECSHCFEDHVKLMGFDGGNTINGEPTYCCDAYPKKDTTSCVTGETTTHRSLCSEHNSNGQCSKYKPLSYLRLKNLLKEYIKDNPMDWACRITPEHAIAEDLLQQLEGKDSRFVESIYTGNNPYEHTIVVTKDAIDRSLQARKYRLEAEHDGDSYGGGNDITETDYEKRKSWLTRKKRNLRQKK